MNREEIPVKTNTYVSIDQLCDTLCSALEGGSTYWCYSFEPERYVEGTEWGHEQVALGVPFEIGVVDEDERIKVDNSKAHLSDALQYMADEYPLEFESMVRDVGDAYTGDLLFQIICFGEVVYG